MILQRSHVFVRWYKDLLNNRLMWKFENLEISGDSIFGPEMIPLIHVRKKYSWQRR